MQYGSSMLDPYYLQALFMRNKRKTLRLRSFDYSSSGAYFITICSHKRILMFDNDHLRKILFDAWNDIPRHYGGVALDEFVIMPNHVHGILHMKGDGDASSSRRSILGNVVGSFKSTVTRKIHKENLLAGEIWQRYFFERVIRNDGELNSLRKYILENPIKWRFDKENPESVSRRGRACPTPTEDIASIFEKE